jgi:WD40 repeat protein
MKKPHCPWFPWISGMPAFILACCACSSPFVVDDTPTPILFAKEISSTTPTPATLGTPTLTPIKAEATITYQPTPSPSKVVSSPTVTLSTIISSPTPPSVMLSDSLAHLEIINPSNLSRIEQVALIDGRYNDFSFSPDGSFFVLAYDEGLAFYNSVTLRRSAFLQLDNPIIAVAIDREGKFLATGGTDGAVEVWELDSLELVHQWDKHPLLDNLFSDILDISFSPDGKYLAATTVSANAVVWEISTGAMQGDYGVGQGPISAIEFSPDGQLLAHANWLGAVWIFNLESEITHNTLHIFNEDHLAINTLAFDPSGEYLSAAGVGRRIYTWSIETGKLVYSYAGHDGWISSISYSPDGSLIASADQFDGSIHLRDPSSTQLLRRLQPEIVSGGISKIGFNPEGTMLLSLVKVDSPALLIWAIIEE